MIQTQVIIHFTTPHTHTHTHTLSWTGSVLAKSILDCENVLIQLSYAWCHFMSWQQSIKIYWPLFSIHYNLCPVIKGHLTAPLHNLNELHTWVEGESDINGSKIPISLQYTHTKISKTLFLEFHILFSFYFTLELSSEIGFGALFLQNFRGPGLVRIRK